MPARVTAELAQAGDALVQLWSAAGSRVERAGRQAGQVRRRRGKDDSGDARCSSGWLDPRQWMAGTGELDDVLARMAEGPRLADLWDLERRFARVMRAWTAMRRRALEHQRRRAGRVDAGGAALHGGAGRARERGRASRSTTSARWRSGRRWPTGSCCRRSAPSGSWSRSGELIRSSTELRMAQQDLVEHFGKQYGFPTRTRAGRRAPVVDRDAARVAADAPRAGRRAGGSAADAAAGQRWACRAGARGRLDERRHPDGPSPRSTRPPRWPTPPRSAPSC